MHLNEVITVREIINYATIPDRNTNILILNENNTVISDRHNRNELDAALGLLKMRYDAEPQIIHTMVRTRRSCTPTMDLSMRSRTPPPPPDASISVLNTAFTEEDIIEENVPAIIVINDTLKLIKPEPSAINKNITETPKQSKPPKKRISEKDVSTERKSKKKSKWRKPRIPTSVLINKCRNMLYEYLEKKDFI